MNSELTVFSADLIPVYTTDTGQQVVIGTELHESLDIKTAYKDWFPRMTEYGFEDGKDFSSYLGTSVESKTGRPKKDHILSLDMAKHIAMIQRTEKGKQIRQKLIELEKKITRPDSYLIADPIERAKAWIKEQEERKALELTTKVQAQQIAEMQPKVSYYDLVLNCKDLLSITSIAKDYGKSAVWMNQKLHELRVQFKQSDQWFLYQKYAEQGYTSTKTSTFNGSDGLPRTKNHTYWTQKGRLFIYDLLKCQGILPLIERGATA